MAKKSKSHIKIAQRHHNDLVLMFDQVPKDDNLLDRLRESFGFPPITRKLRADALLSLVAAAVRAAWIEKRTSVSFAKSFYTGKQKLYGSHFTYRHIVGAFGHVDGYGVFGINKVPPGTHNVDQSTFWATEALLNFVTIEAFSSSSVEPVQMKDDSGKPMSFPTTPQADRVRTRMVSINEYLQNLEVSFSDEYKFNGLFYKVGRNRFQKGPVQLHRVFTRGKLDCHGRLYGRHTNIESEHRAGMLFDGEPTVELEFNCLHPHMLYAREGIQLSRDIYDVGFIPRKLWKYSFNISVNAGNALDADRALNEKIDQCYKTCSMMNSFMLGLNPDISKHFYSDAGVGLQFQESEMILDVMETLLNLGIMNLPVHDSLIVPLEHEDIVVEIMELAYRKHNNGFKCLVSRK